MTGFDDRTPDAWRTAPRPDSWHNDNAAPEAAPRRAGIAAEGPDVGAEPASGLSLPLATLSEAAARYAPRPFGARFTPRLLEAARMLGDQAEDIHDRAITVRSRGAVTDRDVHVLTEALGAVLFRAAVLCNEIGISLADAVTADLLRRHREHAAAVARRRPAGERAR